MIAQCNIEEENEYTVTEPPTTNLMLTTMSESRATFYHMQNEVEEESPIQSEGELEYDRDLDFKTDRLNSADDNLQESFQKDAKAQYSIRIVYPEEGMKKSMCLAEFKNLEKHHEETHLEALYARRKMCETDFEYAAWFAHWVQNRHKTLDLFKKCKSQTWTNFKAKYRAMKEGKHR